MNPPRTCVRAMLAALLLIQAMSFPAFSAGTGGDAAENLQILQPLVAKTWTGKIRALDGDRYMDIVRRFETVWDGSAIRITGHCKELNSEREGYIYWDSDQGKVAMFAINNRGVFQQGYIEREQGNIVITGHITFPDRRLAFRNVFELTADGRLTDRWYRQEENGEWVPGHSVELIAEE